MATELGKAYVQIMPSAKGFSGALKAQVEPEAASAGNSAGGSLGSSLVKAAMGVISVAAIGKAIGASLTEGAALQQSLGGIETLFKDNADTVKKYASEGYKTAGLSANDYMETVTGFAASMVKSLGGDTSKAAELSNQAIVDMADNANKMGTATESIQYAYQGFAKQNYTMLDNLKLGYGGTKEEMQRLLTDAEKISGVKYDISSFSDVTQAIHVMQTEMGITGTTAKEAASTFSGSFASMKASLSNVLGNLALGNDIQPSLNQLVSSASTFLFDNFIPMVGNIFKALPGAVATLVSEGGKAIAKNLGIGLGSGMSGVAGKMSETIQPIISGFQTAFSQLPALFESIVTAIGPIIENIATAFTKLDFSGIQSLISSVIPAIQTAFTTFMGIVGPAIDNVVNSFVGLWNALQPVISALASALMPAFQIVASFLGGVFKGILETVAFAFDAIKVVIQILTPAFQFLVGIFQTVAPVLSTIAEWVGYVVGAFTGLGGSGSSLKEILTGAWDGIKNAVSAAKDFISGAIDVVKTIFSGLGTAGDGLKSVLSAVWDGIKTAISVAKDVISGVIDGIKGFFSGLSDAGNSMKDLLKGAWDALVGVISGAKNTISGIIDSIKGFFKGLGKIDLLGAGKAIIDGFLKGLKSSFEGVKNFIGGIGDWIAEHKGPISYDKKLLIPAGNAIMSGLNQGLQDSFGSVQGTVLSITDMIQGAVSNDFGAAKISAMSDVDVAGGSVNPISNVITLLESILEALKLQDLSKLQMVLDNGAIVGELLPGIDDGLGDRSVKKDRGRA